MANYVPAEASARAVELAKGTANAHVTKVIPARPVINALKDTFQTIGNVQLFVNLVFILYARWRFKTKLASLIIHKNSNFCRFSTSIFHKGCSLRSQKSKFYGF